jgi:hypothetical protein
MVAVDRARNRPRPAEHDPGLFALTRGNRRTRPLLRSSGVHACSPPARWATWDAAR